MTTMEISSPTRRQIADWARLTQKKFRRERGQFLVEGEICVREALRARREVEAVLALASEAEKWRMVLAEEQSPVPLYSVNAEAFRRFAKAESSQGVVAVARMFELAAREGAFAIACEQVSDPGNCGALIRVADFFGASELFLGEDSAEIWNAKVVRGSMGSVFHQPVREEADLLKVIHAWRGCSVALVSHGGTSLRKRPELKPPILMVLGHETRGLSTDLAKACTHRLTLKPSGNAESLNLVTAAAVFAFAVTH